MKLSLPTSDYISSYAVAKMMVDTATNAYVEFWELIRRSQAHIKGEAPVPYEQLEKKGIAWSNNDNYNKAKAKIEKGVGKNVASISKSLMMGYVTFRGYEETKDKKSFSFMKDPNMRGIISSAIAYAFCDMLSKEHRLASFLLGIEYPSFAFGFSALAFDDSDWAPDVIHPLNVAFRPKTKPEKVNTWIVFHTINAEELYKRYVECYNESINEIGTEANGSSAKFSTSGWNKEALEEILLRAYRGQLEENGKTKRPEEWATVFSSYRTDASSIIENTEDVTFAKVYRFELDGTLSIVYIPYAENRDAGSDWMKNPRTGDALTSFNSASSLDMRVFKKNLEIKDVSEKLTLIRDSGFTETSYIEDLRGICKYAVKDSIRYNRLMNGMMNKLLFSGSPFFQSTNTASKSAFKLGVGPGYIITDSDYPLADKQPSFDIGADMAFLRFHEGDYLRETETYDPSLKGRLSSRPNKDEVRGQQQEVEELGDFKNYVKYLDYSRLFFSMLKKISSMDFTSDSIPYKGQKRFFDKLIELLEGFGIKKKADIKKLVGMVESYCMEQIVGDEGSIMLAIQQAETPFGRNRYKRMLLAVRGFPIEEINLDVPLITDKFTMMQDEVMATFENDMFWNGSDAIVQGTNDHIIHFNTHAKKGQMVVKGWQEGNLAANAAFKYLSNLLPHSLIHLQFLGEDPTLRGVLEQLGPVYEELVNVNKQIKQAAMQEMEAQAQAAEQPQIDPKTQSDIARDNLKAQDSIARKNRLEAARTDQAYQKIDNTHEEKMTAIQLDAQVKQYEQSTAPEQ